MFSVLKAKLGDTKTIIGRRSGNAMTKRKRKTNYFQNTKHYTNNRTMTLTLQFQHMKG